jgi:hypothetical protein
MSPWRYDFRDRFAKPRYEDRRACFADPFQHRETRRLELRDRYFFHEDFSTMVKCHGQFL